MNRAQITFDYLDTENGELSRREVRPATRPVLWAWLADRFSERDGAAFAVEGCTGWRFVVEELLRAGIEPHLAEPADTATLRGRKQRAKTDRADARLLRELLAQQRLPESWIPPAHVLEVRTLGRLYVTLMDERRAWQQRIHAQRYNQGVPPAGSLLTGQGRAAPAAAPLSPAGRQMVESALAAIDALSAQIDPLRAAASDRPPPPGPPGTDAALRDRRALRGDHLGGAGRLPALLPLRPDRALRGPRRHRVVFGRQTLARPPRTPGLAGAALGAVRGRQIRVPQHLARPRLYPAARDRLGGKRPTLSVARKLVRRCHHTLRELGEHARMPLADTTASACGKVA